MTVRPDVGMLFAFPVTLGEAMTVLNLSAEAVGDLVRMGVMSAYLPSAAEVPRPEGVSVSPRFTVASVTATAQALLPAEGTEAVELSTVARLLREYLRSFPPRATTEEAVSNDAPMLAASKRLGPGLPYAHVQVPVLVAFIQRELGRPEGRQVRARMATVVEDALRRLGARSMRGVSSLEGGPGQSWLRWWRLPHSVWSPVSADVFDGVLSTVEDESPQEQV